MSENNSTTATTEQDIVKQVKIHIENLSLSFGGAKALTDVSLDIKDHEILAVIGPNGAGKTCILNCLNGFYKPQKGDIYFEGKKNHPDTAGPGGPFRFSPHISEYRTIFRPVDPG